MEAGRPDPNPPRRSGGYRQFEQDEVYHEQPAVTLSLLRALEQTAESPVRALEKMLKAEG